jgi:murein L,D-transpeptidase YafK
MQGAAAPSVVVLPTSSSIVSVRSRTLACWGVAACIVALALAGADAHARQPHRKARAEPPARKQAVVVDGQAEARLIEIYKLIAQAKTREALKAAESLVREHPNFQLAQLVYGDLLMMQSRPVRAVGDVPEGPARQGAQTLAELREESLLRIRALRERPPAGAIPAQFLQLSAQNKHAIAVDTSRSRLYLFENGPTGLKLIADFYVSVGKLGTEKSTEGDLRTPLGVYFITTNLDPKSLKDFYGVGALPINYPNPYDARRGKTGSGIWLHGTPATQYSRAPKATDGCIVLANPDLMRIIRTVEIRTTPVVITPSLRWVPPQGVQADSRSFVNVLHQWRAAKASGDVDRILSFYEADFSGNGRSLAEWKPVLQGELKRVKGRELQLKDLSLLRWTDTADTMVVTFGEVAAGARTGPVKRQYWMRHGAQWKIFFEGVIG